MGFKELDLIYMKGSKGHSGFPEVSYGKYANILVSKGLVHLSRYINLNIFFFFFVVSFHFKMFFAYLFVCF